MFIISGPSAIFLVLNEHQHRQQSKLSHYSYVRNVTAHPVPTAEWGWPHFEGCCCWWLDWLASRDPFQPKWFCLLMCPQEQQSQLAAAYLILGIFPSEKPFTSIVTLTSSLPLAKVPRAAHPAAEAKPLPGWGAASTSSWLGWPGKKMMVQGKSSIFKQCLGVANGRYQILSFDFAPSQPDFHNIWTRTF